MTFTPPCLLLLFVRTNTTWPNISNGSKHGSEYLCNDRLWMTVMCILNYMTFHSIQTSHVIYVDQEPVLSNKEFGYQCMREGNTVHIPCPAYCTALRHGHVCKQKCKRFENVKMLKYIKNSLYTYILYIWIPPPLT